MKKIDVYLNIEIGCFNYIIIGDSVTWTDHKLIVYSDGKPVAEFKAEYVIGWLSKFDNHPELPLDV